MRLRESETNENGEEITRIIAGAGIVVHMRHDAPGSHAHLKPADMRRAFKRFCASVGVVATPCEYGHGHFDQRGKPIVSGLVSAFQCIGNVKELSAVASHFAVVEWHPAINVAIPFAAAGSGPEKVRSSPPKPSVPKTTHDSEEAIRQHRRYLRTVEAERREASCA